MRTKFISFSGDKWRLTLVSDSGLISLQIWPRTDLDIDVPAIIIDAKGIKVYHPLNPNPKIQEEVNLALLQNGLPMFSTSLLLRELSNKFEPYLGNGNPCPGVDKNTAVKFAEILGFSNTTVNKIEEFFQ